MERLMILLRGSASGGRNAVGAGALVALVILLGMAPMAVAGQSSGPAASAHPLAAGQQTYSSATEASEALLAALQKEDEASLLRVLGGNAKEILSSGDDAEE